MSIHYQVRTSVNPNGQTGVDYASNFAVKSGDSDFKSLAERISLTTSVTAGDAYGVLLMASELIQHELLQGKRVVFGDLGAFQLKLPSKCYKQSLIGTDSFDPSTYFRKLSTKLHGSVYRTRVLFRPEASLLRYLRQRYTLHRIPSELMD